MTNGGARTAAWAARLWAALGAGLLAIAMWIYPGGTWFDRGARGHRFWTNFLCDLQQPLALNGTPNPLGSRLAQAGVLSMLLACVPIWLLVPRLVDSAKARWARTLGVLGCALACAVPFLPSERWPVGHSIAIAVAGLPGLTALGLATGSLARARSMPLWLRALSLGLMAAALGDGLYWGGVVVSRVAMPAALPALQKVAALLLLGWIFAVAREAIRSGKSPLGHR